MLRILRNTIKIIAAIVGVIIVLAVLLVWRFSVKPLKSDVLTPYIESGIESIVPNSQVHLGSSLLTWDARERVFSAHAENIEVSDANGSKIASIPSLDAKISPLGLIFGHFVPKDLIIDHPQIKLDRTKDGVFVFGGMTMGGAEDAQANQSHEPIDEVVRKGVEYLSHTILMNRLEVKRAVFDVHDEGMQKTWSIAVPEISIKRNGLRDIDRVLMYGSLEGRITLEITQKDAVATMDVYYAYNPITEQHTLTSAFDKVTPAYIAGGHPETVGLDVAAIADLPLTGNIKFTLDDKLSVISVAAQIRGEEGQLVYPDFWDKPCPVKSFSLKADYDRAAHRLKVSDTHIDFAGPTLDVTIDGSPSKQSGQDLDFTMALKVNNLPMNRYGEIWPKSVLPNPRYWLTANLRDGKFTEAEVTLNGALAWNDLANLSITDGGGKVSAVGGRVIYVEGMPPAEGVGALATFDLKKMDVQITGGGIGNIRMSPFTIHIAGLAEVDQIIDIPLKVSGPLPDILRLLDHPPLSYAKALGISPDDLNGKIEGTVNFHFPLLKTLEMKDAAIDATANASAVASTKLIPGVPIDQGNLALTLTTTGFNLKGPIALGKAPFQVVWQENFEEQKGKPLRQTTVTGAIKEDQWANFGITAFDGTKGPIKVTLEMTKPVKNKLVVSAMLDMTPAALVVDMLDWKKPANVPAILKFTAEAPNGKPVELSSIVLQGAQESAKGSATLSSDMSELLSLDLSPVILGRTNASVHFKQTPNGAARYDVKGYSLDISGLRGKKESEGSSPRPEEYHMQVDKLYTGGEEGQIESAQGFAVRDAQGWKEISLHGLASGDTPVSVELTPQPNGTTTLKIACDNLGKAVKGLGYGNMVKDGKLSISGQSTVESPHVIVGKAKINDFTVENLPILALLLNATSPFGFADLLTDRAHFSRFEGDYRWQGNQITVARAHAAGSAVGINVEGIINLDTGNANLQGTVVPFSVMNNMLNYIPLVGGLITGGKDQGVLAVSYHISGPLSSPKISVNPVSLLTPGFIRNLFFNDEIGEDNDAENNN